MSSALTRDSRPPVSTYNGGKPYAPARGRHAPRQPVEDYVLARSCVCVGETWILTVG